MREQAEEAGESQEGVEMDDEPTDEEEGMASGPGESRCQQQGDVQLVVSGTFSNSQQPRKSPTGSRFPTTRFEFPVISCLFFISASISSLILYQWFQLYQ